jgi:hypothetical protein
MEHLKVPLEYINTFLLHGYVEGATYLAESSEYGKKSIEKFMRSKESLTSNIKSGLNVYVDTTTVSTTSQILFHHRTPSAFTFFDLGILTTALVLFDHVYLPFGPMADSFTDTINEELEEKVIETLNFNGAAGDIPHSVATNLSMALKEKSLHDDLLSVWKNIFGDLVSDSVNFSKVAMVSPPCFSEFLFSLDELDKYGDDLENFISFSTFRTFFNHEMSRILDLPYLPNSSRGAIETKIYQLFSRQIPQIDLLLKIVKRKIELDLESIKPVYNIHTSLPLLMAVILKRMNKLDDYTKIIKKMRSNATKYRKKVRPIIEAATKGDIGQVQETVRILMGGYGSIINSLGKIGKNAGRVAICLSPNVSPIAEETLDLLKAAKYVINTTNDVGKARQIYTRLFKPHIWFIEDVCSSARKMLELDYGFQKIWNYNLRASDKKLLETISANYPFSGLSNIQS